jgi:hypothetical protein
LNSVLRFWTLWNTVLGFWDTLWNSVLGFRNTLWNSVLGFRNTLTLGVEPSNRIGGIVDNLQLPLLVVVAIPVNK